MEVVKQCQLEVVKQCQLEVVLVGDETMYFVYAFAGAIPVTAVVYYWRRGVRIRVNVRELAEKYGMKPDFSKKFAPIVPLPTAAGEMRGRRIFLRTYVTTRPRIPITQVNIELEERIPLKFEVLKKAPKSTQGRVDTGDAEFERRAVLVTDQPALALACLNAETLRTISTFPTLNRRFRLENGLLIYEEQGLMMTRAMLRRFERALDVMFDLADTLDSGLGRITAYRRRKAAEDAETQ